MRVHTPRARVACPCITVLPGYNRAALIPPVGQAPGRIDAPIDARGRALVAQALFTGLGGGMKTPEPLPSLAAERDLRRATAWGLAIRLGQRLSGGVAGPLENAKLGRADKAITLTLAREDAAIYGEIVERRHKALAAAYDGEARLVID